jgi:hypothetical protein
MGHEKSGLPGRSSLIILLFIFRYFLRGQLKHPFSPLMKGETAKGISSIPAAGGLYQQVLGKIERRSKLSFFWKIQRLTKEKEPFPLPILPIH